ncbi:immunophilin FKBP46 [Culex quinquefasciatus]|uniref:Immunophilin FKBP46 n=1 Tax=Culex quinquefasciatus TaxID=7176 RepID=B0WWM8_CULQU|nr:immunophilin FKBP46 [Culex quinquefasciatus]|eukprot:XP_001861800.1 immunophilin FKBP46 [Culex quinquefasciatus]
MTVEYNSDCELNEGDTLCIEDSVEGQEPKTGEDPQIVGGISQFCHFTNNSREEGHSTAQQNFSTNRNWHHNFKKLSRIIDSDSDEADRTVTTRRNLITELGSDSDQLAKQNQTIDAIGDEIDKTMSRLKSLVDLDSSSRRDQESKERSQAMEKKKDPKDLLASLNLELATTVAQRLAAVAAAIPSHPK